MLIKKPFIILAALAAIPLLTSCAVTTDATESSSETFGNTSEASSEVTSSTSPHNEGEKESVKLLRYVETNYAQLRSDVSVGEGERLEALASLLSISREKQGRFYASMMNNFDLLYPSSDTTAEQFVANLHSLMQKNIL